MKPMINFVTLLTVILFPMTAFSQQMMTSNVQPKEFSAYQVDFQEGKSTLIKDYKDNAKALKSLIEAINSHIGKLNRGEYILSVLSETVVMDTEKKAQKLAKKRALTVKSYLIKTVGAQEKYFKTINRVGEKGTVWDGVRVNMEPKTTQDDKTAQGRL